MHEHQDNQKPFNFIKAIAGLIALGAVAWIVVKKAKKIKELWSAIDDDAKLEMLLATDRTADQPKPTPAERKSTSKSKPKSKASRKEAVRSAMEGLNKRQQKILSLLEDNNELKMKEISGKIGQVTPRTLRRDMTKLEKMQLIRQSGKTRDTVYSLR